MMAGVQQNIEFAREALASMGDILSACGVTHVFLFGSRSRGDFRPDSDWDFLVEWSFPITPEEYWMIRWEMAWVIKGAIQITSSLYSDPVFVRSISPNCCEVWRR
jgi:predicted nucleotidyltransferase